MVALTIVVALLSSCAALSVGRIVPSPHLVAACRIVPTPHTVLNVVTRRHVSRAREPRCGWGPEPVWSELSIASIEDAAEGLKAVTITPADGTADGFTVPGQYVQIRQPGAEKAGFFAIASAPGASGPFEFLIKETPPSDWSPGTGWLTGAEAGAGLDMSQVMGGGFKIAEHIDEVERVLLFAAGSGISPIRSVIESGALSGKDVELYYGVRTPAHAAYLDKFDAWSDLGVQYTLCVSAADTAPLQACTGYVQDVAKAAQAFSSAPEKTLILMCGMKGMAMGIKEMAAEAGIDEARVLANF